jgi:hypothetical protein
MRLHAYIVAVAAFLAGTLVAFGFIRWLKYENADLAFVVGAILGTQAAAVAMHRNPKAESTFAVKLLLGTALAAAAVLLGLALHFMLAPFRYVEVSLPILTIGCLLFPFVIFDVLWNAIKRKPGSGAP